MKTFPSVTELTQELVRVPSVNPSGIPGTTEVGEERMAHKVGEYLEALGAEVEIRAVLPGRPNVLGCFKNPRAKGRKILFAPHTDTVSVAGMTIDPFAGELRDGRIYGRGATDTKGPMASMLCAFAQVRQLLATLEYEIWFAGLAGEEAGNDGAIALAEQMTPDFVIAGEPTSLEVVHLHKGAAWFEIVTHGRAVHGSLPHKGESAIYRMSDVIAHIKNHTIPKLTSDSVHPVLGPVTLNVGTIQGGSKVNIVPDFCKIEVDCRFVPGFEDFPAKFCEEIGERFPGVEAGLVRQTGLLNTSADNELVQRLRQLGAPLAGAPWFCDAACFAKKGVPAVAMGPGSIDQAHTEDEWIRVDHLEAGVDFFARFLRSLAA